MVVKYKCMIYENKLYFRLFIIKRSEKSILLKVLTLIEKLKNYRRSKIMKSKKIPDGYKQKGKIKSLRI